MTDQPDRPGDEAGTGADANAGEGRRSNRWRISSSVEGVVTVVILFFAFAACMAFFTRYMPAWLAIVPSIVGAIVMIIVFS